MKESEYHQSTRSAYRGERVESYVEHLEGCGWGRFTMWREMAIVSRMIKKLDVGPNSRILDAPCGTGVACPMLDQTAAVGIGLDMSEEMIRVARETRGRAAYPGFLRADLTELPFSDNCFNGILVIGLLHRVPARVRDSMLAEIYRVTKKFAIVSSTVDGVSQTVKKKMLEVVMPGYIRAPSGMGLAANLASFETNGFVVRQRVRVAPLASSDWIFLIEKQL